MKIQLAIDRVSVEEALTILAEVQEFVDIIEVGTSLIKDFGLESVRRIKSEYPDKKILADMKVIDEVEYEFRAAYDAGADIVTIMGAAAPISIAIGQEVAREYNKEYMIDLLEVEQDKLQKLLIYEDAIFAIHLPADKKGEGLSTLLEESLSYLGDGKRIATAGGVTLEELPLLHVGQVEIAIVGGAITKSEDRRNVAMQMKEMAIS
jgi:3-hexulose-6-phosphate synthase and related proteins